MERPNQGSEFDEQANVKVVWGNPNTKMVGIGQKFIRKPIMDTTVSVTQNSSDSKQITATNFIDEAQDQKGGSVLNYTIQNDFDQTDQSDYSTSTIPPMRYFPKINKSLSFKRNPKINTQPLIQLDQVQFYLKNETQIRQHSKHNSLKAKSKEKDRRLSGENMIFDPVYSSEDEVQYNDKTQEKKLRQNLQSNILQKKQPPFNKSIQDLNQQGPINSLKEQNYKIENGKKELKIDSQVKQYVKSQKQIAIDGHQIEEDQEDNQNNNQRKKFFESNFPLSTYIDKNTKLRQSRRSNNLDYLEFKIGSSKPQDTTQTQQSITQLQAQNSHHSTTIFEQFEVKSSTIHKGNSKQSLQQQQSLLENKKSTINSNPTKEPFTIDIIPSNPFINFDCNNNNDTSETKISDYCENDYCIPQTIQEAIFRNDAESLKYLLIKQKISEEKLNTPDLLFNTPLMLACKLSHKNINLIELIKILLERGANPKIKDRNGWSCLDEAVCQGDIMLIQLILNNLIQRKRSEIESQKEQLIEVLESTPNFYLEMKWEFDSNLIPFLSKLAPSDTFKLWKYDNKLRLDSTVVGIKKFRPIRENMSLIFNPDIEDHDSYAPLYSVYHDKKQYCNILGNIHPEEKQKMVFDLLKADALQGTFNVKECKLQKTKGIFGTSSVSKINGWNAAKYDFKLKMEYAIIKKSIQLFNYTWEEYESRLQEIEGKEISRLDIRNPSLVINQIKERMKSSDKQSPKNKINYDDSTEIQEKKSNISIWVSQGFPLKLETLLKSIGFLSKGNTMLEKLNDLLNKDNIKSVLTDNSFPMKFQIPISFSIKANITVTKYEPLNHSNPQELFKIPKHYEFVTRKVAQKTLQNPKKRMILLNMLT